MNHSKPFLMAIKNLCWKAEGSIGSRKIFWGVLFFMILMLLFLLMCLCFCYFSVSLATVWFVLYSLLFNRLMVCRMVQRCVLSDTGCPFLRPFENASPLCCYVKWRVSPEKVVTSHPLYKRRFMRIRAEGLV